MIGIKQILIFIGLIVCLQAYSQSDDFALKRNSFQQKDTTYWVYNFREFREALFQHDQIKAKAFFNFPIINEHNEIWYLAYDGNEKLLLDLPKNAKPFSKKDFNTYFDRIFSKEFVRLLLKIKTEELYRKSNYETIKIKKGAATYGIYADFEKSTGTLALHFYSKTAYKDETGNPLDGGEFSIFYFFEITSNGHLRFKEVRIAG